MDRNLYIQTIVYEYLLLFFELLLWVLVIMSFSLKDLKANESRLKDINKVAEDLESEGLMAEEVQAVQQQVGVWPLHGVC